MREDGELSVRFRGPHLLAKLANEEVSLILASDSHVLIKLSQRLNSFVGGDALPLLHQTPLLLGVDLI